MDVKNAFLNGDLKEEIFMKQPPGFSVPGHEEKVCHLFKTIYGLKQSSWCWYKKLYNVFLAMGFTVCAIEHSIFYKCYDKGISIIAVSVNDLTLFASTLAAILAMKEALNWAFKMTDLGEIHWLLGIKIKCNRRVRTISLSQHVYIDTILSHFNLKTANSLSTPTDLNTHLTMMQSPSTPQQFSKMRNVPYQELIGSAMYAAVAT